VPLAQIGGDGVFVTEIERALHEKRIDVAVHSLKDLPTTQPQGLRLMIMGPREDVRDVLISNGQTWPARGVLSLEDGTKETRSLRESEDNPPLNGVPNGWEEKLQELRIGTCSLRRIAQLRIICPGAQLLAIRGNVDTRLRKLAANEYDGIVLAAAGLHRLDLLERLAGRVSYLPIDMMMPAPGQGALAVEMREELEIIELLSPLNDIISQATTSAERMFMRRLGAGCYLPVAAYGEISGETLTLRGLVISLDGKRQVRVQQSMHWTTGNILLDAERLGVKVAEQALEQGAGEIIGALTSSREQEQLHA
ncbi:MAG: hydroxymethylbilane synthase, partial [Chloroflexota bacterium]|nr:hydroxymethylbilane synthase [Chloroflexota bacterium]